MSSVVKRGGRLVAAFCTLSSIYGVFAYFNGEPLKGEPIGFILLISIGFNFWLLLEMFILVRQPTLRMATTDMLLQELKYMKKVKDYHGILRRRSDFSRSLWVEGKVGERFELGKIAEMAAVQVGDKEAQVAALIDDLGWSSIQLGKYKDAKRYLEHGLNIAKSELFPYWIAKGHRHLAGLNFNKEKYEDAEAHLLESINSAENILDAKVKNELLAGSYYGYALFLVQQKDYEKALEYALDSEKLRKECSDQSREVRIYSLKGKIQEKLDRSEEALDSFRIGFEESSKLGRIDEIVKNARGLARIYQYLDERDESVSFQRIADELLKKHPLPFGEG